MISMVRVSDKPSPRGEVFNGGTPQNTNLALSVIQRRTTTGD